MTLHICRTEMREIHRESLGFRWCFSCRQRTEFLYIVRDAVEPSYYGPVQSIRCGACGQVNGDCGFGRMREWRG